MQWLVIVKALIALAAGIVNFLRERKLIEAGAAQAVAAALEHADNEIRNAKAAGAAIAAELDAYPERLREHDEFERPLRGGGPRVSPAEGDNQPQ